MAAVAGQAKPAPMTTERIQEMLEENFKLIKAIAEQQNQGRLQEMNQFQQKLQENLMLLAAVADAYSNTSANGAATQAAPAAAAPQPIRPAVAAMPNPAGAAGGLPGQYPVQALQPQPQAQAPLAAMGMPGAASATQQQQQQQLTQQQIQAAVQQLARQQQQQFQMPQGMPQGNQQLGSQQALNAVAGLMPSMQGQSAGPGAAQAGLGGFQLPAPPPLNLGM